MVKMVGALADNNNNTSNNAATVKKGCNKGKGPCPDPKWPVVKLERLGVKDKIKHLIQSNDPVIQPDSKLNHALAAPPSSSGGEEEDVKCPLGKEEESISQQKPKTKDEFLELLGLVPSASVPPPPPTSSQKEEEERRLLSPGTLTKQYQHIKELRKLAKKKAEVAPRVTRSQKPQPPRTEPQTKKVETVTKAESEPEVKVKGSVPNGQIVNKGPRRSPRNTGKLEITRYFISHPVPFSSIRGQGVWRGNGSGGASAKYGNDNPDGKYEAPSWERYCNPNRAISPRKTVVPERSSLRISRNRPNGQPTASQVPIKTSKKVIFKKGEYVHNYTFRGRQRRERNVELVVGVNRKSFKNLNKVKLGAKIGISPIPDSTIQKIKARDDKRKSEFLMKIKSCHVNMADFRVDLKEFPKGLLLTKKSRSILLKPPKHNDRKYRTLEGIRQQTEKQMWMDMKYKIRGYKKESTNQNSKKRTTTANKTNKGRGKPKPGPKSKSRPKGTKRNPPRVNGNARNNARGTKKN